MFVKVLHHWSSLSQKEKGLYLGMVFGWLLLLSGLLGLFLWSNQDAGSVSVQALAPQLSTSTDRVGKVIVEVSGAVEAPGVYTLELGSRVADALEIAGYFSKEADFSFIITELNQARELADGDKLYIPFYGEKKNVPSEKSDTKVSINTAAQSVLEELPDIGPKRAEEIIAGRPYQNLDELVSKKIVTEAIFSALKNQLTL